MKPVGHAITRISTGCAQKSPQSLLGTRAMQQDDSAPALANYYYCMHRLLSPICRPVGLRMNDSGSCVVKTNSTKCSVPV